MTFDDLIGLGKLVVGTWLFDRATRDEGSKSSCSSTANLRPTPVSYNPLTSLDHVGGIQISEYRASASILQPLNKRPEDLYEHNNNGKIRLSAGGHVFYMNLDELGIKSLSKDITKKFPLLQSISLKGNLIDYQNDLGIKRLQHKNVEIIY